MEALTSEVFRPTYSKNPARFFLFPGGAIAIGFSILVIYSQFAVVARISWDNLTASLLLLIAGSFVIWLACGRYTTWTRILTILVGFLSFCGLVYSIRVEPPNGLRDTVLLIVMMSIPTYVWMIALRCKPKTR